MKKLILAILPSLLTFLFIFRDSFYPDSKWIIFGIYILFPLIFIIQAIISSSSVKYMIFAFVLLSISIIIPVNQWYRMGSIMPAIIVYIILGTITYLIIRIKKQKNK